MKTKLAKIKDLSLEDWLVCRRYARNGYASKI